MDVGVATLAGAKASSSSAGYGIILFHGGMRMLEQVLELQNARGSLAKSAVLRKYREEPEFRAFLYYALNPLLTYNLSEKTLRDLLDRGNDDTALMFFKNIFDCCEYLSRLRGIDDATLRQVGVLLSKYPEPAREIFIKLLAKTLRLGVTSKTVNKEIPNLIPEWEVQQGYPIDKYPIKDGTEFWLTQKLNGVRATLYRGELIARSGQSYTGVDHILNAVGWIAEELGVVLDGELTLKNKGELSDNEAFRVATGILNSDSEDKTRICYTIFDMISLGDFESDEPQTCYSVRRSALDMAAPRLNTECTQVLPVLYHGRDQHKIWELLERMVAEDKEGLMLNTNVPYYRSRHRGILKVKQFYSMDLPIIRCEEGSGRLAGKLGAFVLDFKGNEVKVGSGFSDEQRSAYWQKRDEFAGMLCEVKYKEISSDKNTGLQSLQFPIFIRVRDDKTEASYG